jgi:hypothetical protein
MHLSAGCDARHWRRDLAVIICSATDANDGDREKEGEDHVP